MKGITPTIVVLARIPLMNTIIIPWVTQHLLGGGGFQLQLDQTSGAGGRFF